MPNKAAQRQAKRQAARTNAFLYRMNQPLVRKQRPRQGREGKAKSGKN